MAAEFWISCRGLKVRPAKSSLQKSSLERARAWTRSYAACSDRKGLIFLMLYKANLQDRAVVAIWSVKLN